MSEYLTSFSSWGHHIVVVSGVSGWWCLHCVACWQQTPTAPSARKTAFSMSAVTVRYEVRFNVLYSAWIVLMMDLKMSMTQCLNVLPVPAPDGPTSGSGVVGWLAPLPLPLPPLGRQLASTWLGWLATVKKGLFIYYIFRYSVGFVNLKAQLHFGAIPKIGGISSTVVGS